ncbi:MAG TPA: prepilin-type N-terminal cleavage/methylation domain-containing protein [Candidatus Ozemobacteraceae bacterium]|nr:prepilin-type N-terminal cleavage/methylation domain-containing protein [Candidatus Ozemobacteraceae bacterium]
MKRDRGDFLKRRGRTGFTLVEILIATAVFSLFLGGLFSLYRMGSSMFQAGSWKLQKQKEAERFLALVKERLEQASPAAIVNPSANPQLTETLSRLGYVSSSINRANLGNTPSRLLLFTVCKPSIGATPGLVLYHGVRAVPTPGSPNLFNLEFISTTTAMHAFFSNTGFAFFPSGTPDLSRFNQPGSPPPGAFRLGGDLGMTEVTEVASMAISCTSVASESLLSISLEFRHPNPRYDKTSVLQRIVSRIEVPVEARILGGL